MMMLDLPTHMSHTPHACSAAPAAANCSIQYCTVQQLLSVSGWYRQLVALAPSSGHILWIFKWIKPKEKKSEGVVIRICHALTPKIHFANKRRSDTFIILLSSN